MSEENGTPASEEKDIITLVDEKISSDADFQTELEALSEEDKVTRLQEKKAELFKQEFATVTKKVADGTELANNYKIRAEKAEQEAKKTPPEPPINKPNDQQLPEELKLIARGLTDEAIEQAKVIAKGKDIPLTEAIKDPLFTIYQQDAEVKAKKEKAKLGASKGSGETPSKSGVKSGMTREEHEKAFQKANGN